jgi:hypothetical protein
VAKSAQHNAAAKQNFGTFGYGTSTIKFAQTAAVFLWG